MRDLVDMAADRGAFIDQSQSFNAFMETPTKAKVRPSILVLPPWLVSPTPV